MSFTKDLSGFTKTYKKNADKKLRELIFIMLRRIIALTPVDTGRAKSNWYVELDRISGLVRETGVFDKSGAQALLRGIEEANRINSEKNDKIYIYNNLDYITGLENGRSKQSDSMVATAIQEAKIFLNASN